MTFGELKGLVQSAIAEQALTSETVRPIFLDNIALWVINAIQRVDAELMWTQKSQIFTTVAGQREYEVPKGLLFIQQVVVGNNVLQPITQPEALYKALTAESVQGTPIRFAWYGENIILVPTPSEALQGQIWGVWTPDPPASDDDEPSLPPHVHNLIVDYALYQAYRHLGDVERMRAVWELWRLELEQDRSSVLVQRGIFAVRRDEGVG